MRFATSPFGSRDDQATASPPPAVVRRSCPSVVRGMYVRHGEWGGARAGAGRGPPPSGPLPFQWGVVPLKNSPPPHGLPFPATKMSSLLGHFSSGVMKGLVSSGS